VVCLMRRIIIAMAAVRLAFAAYAGAASAVNLTGITAFDAVDALPGDGVCADAAGSGRFGPECRRRTRLTPLNRGKAPRRSWTAIVLRYEPKPRQGPQPASGGTHLRGFFLPS
jgi:hypothetical protein